MQQHTRRHKIAVRVSRHQNFNGRQSTQSGAALPNKRGISPNVESDFCPRTAQSSIWEENRLEVLPSVGVYVAINPEFAWELIGGSTKNKRLQPRLQLKPLEMDARQ